MSRPRTRVVVPSSACLLVAVACASVACGGSKASVGHGDATPEGSITLGNSARGDSGGGHTKGDSGTSGSTPDVDAAGDGGFCSQTGPVVQLPGSSGKYNICTSQIGETLFQSALCTCRNTEVAGYLHTSGFNSTTGQKAGAPVGINNDYKISAGYTQVGGSMSIAGPDSVAFIGYIEADGDLSLEGTATVPGYTQVHGNGWLGAKFTDIGPATFGGDLYHQGAVVAVPLSVSGANKQQSVTIPDPCPCQPADILDIAAIVAQGKASNDNASIGLSPSAWVNILTIQTVNIPCGRYYLDSIQIAGKLVLNVTGRVAIFVGSDITGVGDLEIQLAGTAEVDLFIQNDLNLVGYGGFGNKARPAATRIYVGGSGNVNLIGAGEFIGNLYAPLSTVTSVGYVDVHGAIFSKDFQIPGYADFTYDAAITTIGDDCPPVEVPGQCTQCGECTNGSACVAGKCGTCTQDSDCCGQSVCSNGACGPLLK
jgi:hypothetical protein